MKNNSPHHNEEQRRFDLTVRRETWAGILRRLLAPNDVLTDETQLKLAVALADLDGEAQATRTAVIQALGQASHQLRNAGCTHYELLVDKVTQLSTEAGE